MLSGQIKELEEEEGGGSSDNSGSGNDSNDSRTKKSKVRSDDGTWSANSSGAQSRPPKTVNVPIHLFFKGESEDDELMMYDFLKVNKKTAIGFNMNTKYFRGGRKTAGRCIEIQYDPCIGHHFSSKIDDSYLPSAEAEPPMLLQPAAKHPKSTFTSKYINALVNRVDKNIQGPVDQLIAYFSSFKEDDQVKKRYLVQAIAAKFEKVLKVGVTQECN